MFILFVWTFTHIAQVTGDVYMVVYMFKYLLELKIILVNSVLPLTKSLHLSATRKIKKILFL